MKANFFGIIPARGGSKGVKNKNIRLVNNKPLIQYTIEASQNSQKLSSFIVSTDSEEIAAIARSLGASVPFIRPREYAADETPMTAVIDHAVKWLEDHTRKTTDYLVLLQPTTPFRSAEDIDRAIDLISKNRDADCLISCYDASHVHPSIMYVRHGQSLSPYTDDLQIKRRQEFQPVYVRNGCIYIIKRDFFERERRLVNEAPLGYIMPRWKSINIDEEFDLVSTEALIQYCQLTGLKNLGEHLK